MLDVYSDLTQHAAVFGSHFELLERDELLQGESVAGFVLQIGNTNSRYRFPISVKELLKRWSQAGPAHHCAIGVGHVAGKLEKLAQLLGIAMQQVC